MDGSGPLQILNFDVQHEFGGGRKFCSDHCPLWFTLKESGKQGGAPDQPKEIFVVKEICEEKERNFFQSEGAGEGEGGGAPPATQPIGNFSREKEREEEGGGNFFQSEGPSGIFLAKKRQGKRKGKFFSGEGEGRSPPGHPAHWEFFQRKREREEERGEFFSERGSRGGGGGGSPPATQPIGNLSPEKRAGEGGGNFFRTREQGRGRGGGESPPPPSPSGIFLEQNREVEIFFMARGGGGPVLPQSPPRPQSVFGGGRGGVQCSLNLQPRPPISGGGASAPQSPTPGPNQSSRGLNFGPQSRGGEHYLNLQPRAPISLRGGSSASSIYTQILTTTGPEPNPKAEFSKGEVREPQKHRRRS